MHCFLASRQSSCGSAVDDVRGAKIRQLDYCLARDLSETELTVWLAYLGSWPDSEPFGVISRQKDWFIDQWLIRSKR